jgi:hypothetical protein
MAKIKIGDIAETQKISEEEMGLVFGKSATISNRPLVVAVSTIGHAVLDPSGVKYKFDPSKPKIDPRAMPDNTDTCW